ncbi:hypothetical protein Z045_05630 [Rhodococcus pyridinivorans KG-16]|uniref:Uncharacterized protein n=1 Tax=Rhodococcus pyridinivorans KG-16 TaxID=1441730 RepID=A0A0V9UNT4_9NOCA|nr:hypothetical protein [Rhodococcus pyridinivorans]KSZ59652.1 hypothetical protein Z045_05630 [Rhodococcus pyridinivorans KG-16]
MNQPLPLDQLKMLQELTKDAHSMAETIDELSRTNPLLSTVLLAAMDVYLEAIREHISYTIGVPT